MARGPFTSSKFLRTLAPPVVAAPFMISCWFKLPSVTANSVWWLGDQAVSNQYFRLNASTFLGGQVVYTAKAGFASIDMIGAISTTGWNHILITEHANTKEHRLYVNGTLAASSSTVLTPSGIDNLALGLQDASFPVGAWPGTLAELAIWDQHLAVEADRLALAQSLSLGFSPLLVKPSDLVFYDPLVSGEFDRVGGLVLAEIGTVPVADHPPMYNPSSPMVGMAVQGIDVALAAHNMIF